MKITRVMTFYLFAEPLICVAMDSMNSLQGSFPKCHENTNLRFDKGSALFPPFEESRKALKDKEELDRGTWHRWTPKSLPK